MQTIQKELNEVRIIFSYGYPYLATWSFIICFTFMLRSPKMVKPYLHGIK
jgi:hypothetical protein